MPRNVEVKARVHDMDELVRKASGLCDSSGTVIEQDDTFFLTASGRLKLRVFKNGTGELIYYDRPDCEGPKISDFAKSTTNEPDILRNVLSLSLGVRGRVKKTRLLFIHKQTRIHIDRVEGLGNFMELEVMLHEEETIDEGTRKAEELLNKLGVSKSDLISGAYMDWLDKSTSKGNTPPVDF